MARKWRTPELSLLPTASACFPDYKVKPPQINRFGKISREELRRGKTFSHVVRHHGRVRVNVAVGSSPRRATTGDSGAERTGSPSLRRKARPVRSLEGRWAGTGSGCGPSQRGNHSSLAGSRKAHEVPAVQRRSRGELPANRRTAHRAVSLEDPPNAHARLFSLRGKHSQL